MLPRGRADPPLFGIVSFEHPTLPLMFVYDFNGQIWERSIGFARRLGS